ncbi:MAG: hypothetical protein CMB43_03770 [Euryarchaeota archaeon]|nr:hypothetical protein [Euryarchaeota archaeon]|tara:strand:- start:78 stop:1328 length:1251 start_codon:yes stop_codon:yes gene_type:complete
MSGLMSKNAAVVGAGISGLYACYLLEQEGYKVDLFERSDRIGGRMGSVKKAGFILDRGFHVMQTGYPTAKQILDYEAMGCKSFEPGAMVIDSASKKIKIWRFSDPFRRPVKGFAGVFNFFTSPFNLLRVGLMRLKISRVKDNQLFSEKSITTIDYLRSRGFSERFIHRFFRPLFGGIFLESQLRTDSRMFKFVFKNMSRGNMVLPENGISACPQQLFQRLKNTNLKLNTEVEFVSTKALISEGEKRMYDFIIRAHTPTNNCLTRDVWTLYFAAPQSPLKGKYILLNSNIEQDRSLISHLAVPSDIQPSYAPQNQSLVAVTVVGEDAKNRSLSDERAVEESVIDELTKWFPEQISSWKTLDVQYIQSALPELTGDHYDGLTTKNRDFSCGDHTYHGSVEGALISARLAVEQALKTKV